MRSRSPCPPRARAGFTLVELLVTLAVASLLLAIVSGVMGSARAAAAAEDRAVEPWRALDLAAELLAEELGLAGFEPLGTERVPEPAVTIRPAAGGHAITVSVVDDRVAGTPVRRQVRFEAGEDARGLPQLYRAAGVASRQPLVEGVLGLAVEAVVGADGALQPPELGATYVDARGLVLRLTAAEGRERPVVVLLGSAPDVEVRP